MLAAREAWSKRDRLILVPQYMGYWVIRGFGNEFIPVLYALMCNVQALVEITEFLKTSGNNNSLWIPKTKPRGFLARRGPSDRDRDYQDPGGVRRIYP